MSYVVQTSDGRLFVRRDHVELVQKEIDALLAHDPDAHPIDAATLIVLEANGYTWDFERGHVLPAELN